MPHDYFDLIGLRKTNPAWRLMTADNGPLILSFFDSVFRENNARQISEDELIMQLEDYLYELRGRFEKDSFPKSAGDYLDDWTTPGREWLRKFYPPDSDIPHFDLTPSSERVLQWVDGFFTTGFVGTESRLNTSFELLRQIVNGVEDDKELRIKELKEQKRRINNEIKGIEEGHIDLLDDRQVRERFIQFRRIARELLGDFRSVENHFRDLDHEVRQQIAVWEGGKGELLEDFFGSHDRITDSEEGQSFRAFWDFLMSPSSQEELTRLLDRVYELESLTDLLDDRRLKRIHYDWMAAGAQTQRTVARLSKQLRRYLDDRAFWENRRITEILDQIEKHAVILKDDSPQGDFTLLDGFKADVELPMMLPLFNPPETADLVSLIETAEEESVDAGKLFNLVYIDENRLRENIACELEDCGQIRLQEIIQKHPLDHGLAELISYVNLAEKDTYSLVDEDFTDSVTWTDLSGRKRNARFPRIIFNRKDIKK